MCWVMVNIEVLNYIIYVYMKLKKLLCVQIVLAFVYLAKSVLPNYQKPS